MGAAPPLRNAANFVAAVLPLPVSPAPSVMPVSVRYSASRVRRPTMFSTAAAAASPPSASTVNWSGAAVLTRSQNLTQPAQSVPGFRVLWRHVRHGVLATGAAAGAMAMSG